MRKSILALALTLSMLGACASAQAAEITVYSVGLVGSAFDRIVIDFQKKTGHTVKTPLPLANSPLGVILTTMDKEQADIVILPGSEMPAQAAKYQWGTVRDIGRVLFSLGMRTADGAAPSIATEAEFKAALAGKTVLTNDPVNSLNGRMVKAVLDRPGFETVRQVSSPGNSALVFNDRKEAVYVLSVLPEQLMAAPAVKVAGQVPASLGLRIDFSGGVLNKAQNPALALEFLNYLTSPEAQVVWKSGGVAVPIP